MDGVSFTFALIFFVVLGLWLVNAVAGFALPEAGWLAAVALIVFGVFGLVGSWRARKATSGGAVSPRDPDHT
jgi:hypothetical protein